MCSVEVAGTFIEILMPEGQAFGRIHFHFPRLPGESDRALNARMLEYSQVALAAIRDPSRHAAGAKGAMTTPQDTGEGMELTPEELELFRRVVKDDHYRVLTALTSDEASEAARMLDARGARRACAQCDGATWSWHFWRNVRGNESLVLTRTCQRCTAIESFDATRLYPADPLRARAESWADTLMPLWQSQGLTRDQGVDFVHYQMVWWFTTPEQVLRYDRWWWEQAQQEADRLKR